MQESLSYRLWRLKLSMTIFSTCSSNVVSQLLVLGQKAGAEVAL